MGAHAHVVGGLPRPSTLVSAAIKIEARKPEMVHVTLPCGERRFFRKDQAKLVAQRLMEAVSWLESSSDKQEF